ncbi:spore germination protein [Paenibacillus pasadenensis]|uniref:GerAB/ArcD/ProY family transporter n=1 Tax=Paenibacillus pasadenensis TaxID=217090 RepID=UPI00204132A6|nr:endospore germination permease [Paenibacillus pasadenensis]MCM3747772.1 spore germination protein [Paenibacillus pasadenensis]
MLLANKLHITMRQFKIILFFSVIGDSILIMPFITGTLANEDAWISSLLAPVGGLALGSLYAWIASRQAGQSLVGCAIAIGGKWIGGLLGLVHIFFFYIVILTLLSEISQFMTTQLMVGTPSEAIILAFLIVITAALRYGVESFVRVSELLYPVYLFIFVALFICLVPHINLNNMLPFLGNGFAPPIKGAYPAFAYGFLEGVVLLMLIPHVDQDRKALGRAIRSAFLMGSLIILVVVSLCIFVLGADMMKHKYFSTFYLAQLVEIGGFLQRMEAALAFLWIITVFFKALLFSYSATKGLSEVFRLSNDRIMVMPFMLLLLAGTHINMPNIAEYHYILAIFPNYDVVSCLLLPFAQSLLLGLPAVKKRLSAGSGQNAGPGGT